MRMTDEDVQIWKSRAFKTAREMYADADDCASYQMLIRVARDRGQQSVRSIVQRGLALMEAPRFRDRPWSSTPYAVDANWSNRITKALG